MPEAAAILIQLRLQVQTPLVCWTDPSTVISVFRYGVAQGYRKGNKHLRPPDRHGRGVLAGTASKLTWARINGTLRMKIGNSWAGSDKFKFGHASRHQL